MSASDDVAGIARETCQFPFIHPDHGPDTVRLGHPLEDKLRHNNFDLCRAVDTTKLAVVLQRMTDEGWLTKRSAELFFMQASVLRAQLCTANNAAFAHLQASAS